MASLDELLGESQGMIDLRRRVENLLRKVAGLGELPPILIQGETGTGKTTLARLIHRASARAEGPFVDVNCAEFQESLLESQLFGHERHSFTGAGPGRSGLFQAAHRGVLLLDEIGEMSIALQAKLLKVLDDGAMEVRRLGSTKREAVDVAVVAATHADLRTAVKERRFRQDLYSRLAGLTLEIPPLRARGRDVELLAERFLQQACEQYHLPPKFLAADARAALQTYAWPGNVRELGNVLRRAALESDSSAVTSRDLGLVAQDGPPPRADAGGHGRERLLEVLTGTQWNITRTASALGITRNTVRERMKRFGLESPRPPVTPKYPPPATDAPTAGATPIEDTVVSVGTSHVPLGAAAPLGVHAPGAPTVGLRWTRRRLTFLRARVLGDAGVPLAVTTRSLQAVIERVQPFGGRVHSMSPNAVLVIFGLEPDEEASRRAALAALAIVKNHESEAGDDRRPARPSLAVALHVAQTLVADVAGTMLLDEETKADAGRILDELSESDTSGVALSAAAAQLLGRRFEVVRHANDGRLIRRLVGRLPHDLQFGPTEFVGRGRELMLLEGFLERVTEGRGHVVSIVGEPGIGKSRLVHEFVQGIMTDACTVLRGDCLSYRAHAPYHLVLDILRDACEIEAADTPDDIDRKMRTILGLMGAADEPWAPYIVNLVCPGRDPIVAAVAPEIVRERTFEGVQQLVLAQQERRPLVIVIEDLQWIDQTSAELLAVLADVVFGRRIMLLCTSRPGYPLPGAGRSHASQIALPPLSADGSRRLVLSTLGSHKNEAQLVPAILARGEGNAFFLEELVRVVREDESATQVGIPETVHDVLSSRIVRLRDEDRQLLQIAAIIGRDFPVALLEAVSPLSGEETGAGLARLRTAELVYPRRIGLDAAYTFSHALTWDVANEIMLEDERRALHARVVTATERLYAARLIDHVERLAEHAGRAMLWDRAIQYGRQAGHKAIAHSAYRDAVSYFTQALAALEHIPPGPMILEHAIDLRLELRSALAPLGDRSRIGQIHRELQSLTDQLGDRRRQGLVAALMTGVYYSSGLFEQAVQYGERATEIAASSGDVVIESLACSHLSASYFLRGDYQRAITSAQYVVEILPPERSHEGFGMSIRPAVYARGFLSWALSEVGRFDEAETAARDALQLAEAIGHPTTLASGLLAMGTFSVRRGNLGDALGPLQRAHDLCRRYDLLMWRPTCWSFLGHSLVLDGRITEGEALLREARDESAAAGMKTLDSLVTMWLGEARLFAGAVGEAEDLARLALKGTRDRHEAGLEGWVLRLLAEITAYQQPVGAALAEGLYRDAMQRAEAYGMRPLIARCHLGLGVLGRRAGTFGDVADHLTIARGMFRDMRMQLWVDSVDTELHRPQASA